MTKPWLSKTIWINFLAGLIGFFPHVGEFISSNPQVWTAIFAAVNMILYYVTQKKYQIGE